MAEATRGHQLFVAWLGETYGRNSRGRPEWRGMRAFVYDLNRVLKDIEPTYPQLAQALNVYGWFADAKDPHTPREPYRRCIEHLSRGRVPASSWAEPAEVAPQEFDADGAEPAEPLPSSLLPDGPGPTAEAS
jgi:hypothetical protein